MEDIWNLDFYFIFQGLDGIIMRIFSVCEIFKFLSTEYHFLGGNKREWRNSSIEHEGHKIENKRFCIIYKELYVIKFNIFEI